VLVLTVGALCSAALRKITAYGIAAGFAVAAISTAVVCMHPATKPVTWVFFASDVVIALYFLATAHKLPEGKHPVTPANATHWRVMHFQAGLGTLVGLAFMLARQQVAPLFFARGTKALSPELEDLYISMGGTLIVQAAALCSMRMTRETAQGVGAGFLICAASVVLFALKPIANPLVWAFPLIDGATGLFLLATANSLPSHAESGVTATPSAAATKKGK